MEVVVMVETYRRDQNLILRDKHHRIRPTDILQHMVPFMEETLIKEVAEIAQAQQQHRNRMFQAWEK